MTTGNIASEHGAIGTGQQRVLQSGSGISKSHIYPLGHVTRYGKSGDILRLQTSDFYPRSTQGQIFVQASGCSVKVSTTLADVDLAMSPDQDAGDHWVVDTTAAPGSIMQLKTLATALKLEFLGDGLIYVVGY